MKKVFSKFDVAKAFHSIARKGLAFPLYRNKLWFLSVLGSSYGLISSTSVMTHCTNALFNLYFLSFHHSDRKEHMPEGDHAFCFVDDIILANESKEMHYKMIEGIFHICTEYLGNRGVQPADVCGGAK